MAFLATWDKVPKEQLLAVFERGHFAGVEEMKRNERLFNRVAPMGVNDIAMACQYKFTSAAALDIPVTSFDGLADNTIDPGASVSADRASTAEHTISHQCPATMVSRLTISLMWSPSYRVVTHMTYAAVRP
jgi:surfactin synthase thioesterase subunit